MVKYKILYARCSRSKYFLNIIQVVSETAASDFQFVESSFFFHHYVEKFVCMFCSVTVLIR